MKRKTTSIFTSLIIHNWMVMFCVVPLMVRTSHSLYISVEVVAMSRNKQITSKLFQQRYRCHKLLTHSFCVMVTLLRSTTPIQRLFCNRVSKHTAFYGDVIYRLRKVVDPDNFHDCFVKSIRKSVGKEYLRDILYRTACMRGD